jgi:hypothetical protein
MQSQTKAVLWRSATWTFVCLMTMGFVLKVVAGV